MKYWDLEIRSIYWLIYLFIYFLIKPPLCAVLVIKCHPVPRLELSQHSNLVVTLYGWGLRAALAVLLNSSSVDWELWPGRSCCVTAGWASSAQLGPLCCPPHLLTCISYQPRPQLATNQGKAPLSTLSLATRELLESLLNERNTFYRLEHFNTHSRQSAAHPFLTSTKKLKHTFYLKTVKSTSFLKEIY